MNRLLRSLLAAAALAWPATFPARATQLPFTPPDDSAVVARLRPNGSGAAERQFRAARAALAASPTNLALALDVARQAIRRARAQGDPRPLGQAQTALGPWWNLSAPPVEILVLRATIRQSLHDFPGALADLETAVSRDPRHTAAWLTKAAVHLVRGEAAEARSAAARLAMLADPLSAAVIVAQVAALDGHTAKGIAQLLRALERTPVTAASPPELREAAVWASTVVAELLDRSGRPKEAEEHFRKALSLAPGDPYLLGAFADFLLDQRRAVEVLPLLHDHAEVDALLLRLAEAQRAASPGSEASSVAELRARFDLAQVRGDRLHLREEARFHLRLLGDFATARRLAEENWTIQKEPADARLLAETEPEHAP